MNAGYEHKDAMTFIGFHTAIRPEEGEQKCPEFWDRAYYAKYAHLWQTMQPETPVEAAILENGVGMFAICQEGEYWIAGLYRGGDVPEGLALYSFPESDWAIFSAKGPLPQSLQTLNRQVWQEWAPIAGQMNEIGTPGTLEVYSAAAPNSPDYECGIWVPIKARAEVKICQSCGMPMEPEVYGTNADGSINEDYCKYCYVGGEFTDKVTMEEYIEMCSQFGAQAGMTNEEMKAYCEKLFPTLKRWKR